ncbi:pyridoxamine 5'-phosphate oxidase family protein [Microbacterium sp. ASV49]|uniref:Pyridoxamine 5'-phosphate oxidase family protein n=1 Tax=Microbacterium candidum TaxID=3041922 RepID=A0ABT7N262_9MICO|nr:pyridoxamine 5'-phosphate oxidase family protein [Microbacterium sp. ASV49]MDL9980802.1 pyridoxamine 5'-phosphate oxidase family protein [Microbacterium sp. ASV49]
MELNHDQRAFLQDHHAAAMITTGRDGAAKAVRVGVALVDGHLRSSGTADRARTKRLRRVPRSTLFVFDPGVRYLTIESAVTILDGDDAPELNLALFRVMQNRPSGPLAWYGEELDEEAFLARMVQERRLVYEFTPVRIYGTA